MYHVSNLHCQFFHFQSQSQLSKSTINSKIHDQQSTSQVTGQLSMRIINWLRQNDSGHGSKLYRVGSRVNPIRNLIQPLEHIKRSPKNRSGLKPNSFPTFPQMEQDQPKNQIMAHERSERFFEPMSSEGDFYQKIYMISISMWDEPVKLPITMAGCNTLTQHVQLLVK